jgi:hypothetical protein
MEDEGRGASWRAGDGFLGWGPDGRNPRGREYARTWIQEGLYNNYIGRLAGSRKCDHDHSTPAASFSCDFLGPSLYCGCCGCVSPAGTRFGSHLLAQWVAELGLESQARAVGFPVGLDHPTKLA